MEALELSTSVLSVAVAALLLVVSGFVKKQLVWTRVRPLRARSSRRRR